MAVFNIIHDNISLLLASQFQPKYKNAVAPFQIVRKRKNKNTVHYFHFFFWHSVDFNKYYQMTTLSYRLKRESQGNPKVKKRLARLVKLKCKNSQI